MSSLRTLNRDSLLRVLALCSCRDVLALACTCQELNKQLQDDDLWRLLAEAKWGSCVPKLASVAPGGWAAWTRHRLAASSSSLLSPLDLVQEHYQECPFQHMVACLLCSRTTGGPVVRQAIRCFLERFSTPTAILTATDSSMLEVLNPLGLQATRLAAVQGVARDYIASDWQQPSDFRHCGAFVTESWMIFCCGHRSLAGIGDKNLQRYLRWHLHGSVDEVKRQRQPKRKAEVPAEPGTLRSGRCRSGVAGGNVGTNTGGAQQRRVTRASAAVGAEPAAKRGRGR
ncbi:hypothetical protein D9Q98_001570 [Chlorella vulgaris]|uniref:F-box domain-containing protein n=1 Tax=Chlorella vulgaris TaxID=3077 RepID=A0A9D4TUP2_CHLVU|nr:hypothetical protein D9Q98_001570 [Chlorella vulgaris]